LVLGSLVQVFSFFLSAPVSTLDATVAPVFFLNERVW
jgi:hypothetical protein